MKVLKFGGTSVGSPKAIEQVVRIIHREQHPDVPVLVFSAMGSTTDTLLEISRLAVAQKQEQAMARFEQLQRWHFDLVNELIAQKSNRHTLRHQLFSYFSRLEQMFHSLAVLQDLSPMVQDQILSHGEFISTRILNTLLQERGVRARWTDARQLIKTNSQFTNAEPDLPATQQALETHLIPLLQQGCLPVVQGFVGADAGGRTTTLGRGGSDYTAALIGSLLQANEVQIWTDVDGILTADPTLVEDARLISHLSYQEAAELAYFGARVLHPKTIAPAMERNIPVRVRNIFRSDGEGTCILPQVQGNGDPVKSIAYKEGITLITIVSTRMFKAHDFLRRIFEVFDRYQTPVDLVSTTEVSVALAIHQIPQREQILQELQQFGRVQCQEGKAIVCVVGEQLRGRPGIVGEIFSALADFPISMVSLGGSEINISFVCDENLLSEMIPRLHRRFFSDPDQAPNRAVGSFGIEQK